MEAKTVAIENEQKKHSFETVDIPLVIKLPKPYLEFLGQLAKVLNMSPEAILKDEIYGMLRDFFSSGALEGWVGSLFEDYVNGDKGKQLAAMIEEIDC